jgi:hypothetical protein
MPENFRIDVPLARRTFLTQLGAWHAAGLITTFANDEVVINVHTGHVTLKADLRFEKEATAKKVKLRLEIVDFAERLANEWGGDIGSAGINDFGDGDGGWLKISLHLKGEG